MSNAPSIREAVQARLARRHRAEMRFQFYGLAAITVAVLFLALLLGSILIQSLPAFSANRLMLEVSIDAEQADPRQDGSEASLRRGAYNTLLQNALRDEFPDASDVAELRELFGLYSAVNAAQLLNTVVNDPDLIGTRIPFSLPISDDADLYLKGLTVTERTLPGTAALQLTPISEGMVRLSARGEAPVFADYVDGLRADLETRALAARNRALAAHAAADSEINRDAQESLRAEAARARALADTLEARIRPGEPLELGPQSASLLVKLGDGVIKVTRISADTTQAEGQIILAPDSLSAQVGDWALWVLDTPALGRLITDRQIVWTRALQDRGLVKSHFNWPLFSNADSREPELAGVAGAMAGSILTMLITMFLAVPIGVGAAIYLEEFAPKNRVTDFIEVNINNLAAVPSIVFGLLGLAVFINLFGLPRSAPLVGGMVLALMTLPTVIISSRAALKAVPPSIREAALGVGASRTQAVFHHVLPLAMPGILTGSIIGLAQALGETAPLLMIGMVAFIADPPTLGLSGFTEPATVMPVQIFIWSSSAERAFEARTAAAILVLLTLLVSFNAVAIYLRRRFERRW